MAIREHVEKVKEGIASFNEWRKINPSVVPDLSHEDLTGLSADKIKNWDISSEGYNFENANLWNTKLAEGCLIFSNLKNAILIQADLRKACCIESNMEGANLLNANIEGSILLNVNMEGANVSGVKYNRYGKYRAIRVSTCYGSPRFKRFAQDQDFIEELREESFGGKVLYYLWLVFTDCGRSFFPLLLWSASIIIFFGIAYADYSIPSFLSWIPNNVKDLLVDINPKIRLQYYGSSFTPYYFSVVTFTTLGFGDVVPINKSGEIWVTIEVVLGYVMLGLLISILSDKIARRGAG